ncbi:hypothetical protein [Rhizobium redzepovicii]|uniref:hypothetical protein n=1 Tax=Rhizobium redzepovicii TaxID=2867518 RepID=UPI001C92CA10|nr:hypothetical protein [Rhizobium redzepovicii]MBY4592172.1 hypothetical protein [Rhizobium redzepovicii]
MRPKILPVREHPAGNGFAVLHFVAAPRVQAALAARLSAAVAGRDGRDLETEVPT